MAIISLFPSTANRAGQFDQLVRPHVMALYQFAYRLLRNRADAEDLVQDVLTKLYPRTSEMANLRDLRPWLMRVMYHRFVDEHRRRRRADHGAPVVDPSTLVDPDPGPEQRLEMQQHNAHMHRALAELNADQRLLVGMHLIDGYTLDEVARTLDVPIGTLKSRLHRAKVELKRILQLEPFSSPQRVEGHELL